MIGAGGEAALDEDAPPFDFVSALAPFAFFAGLGVALDDEPPPADGASSARVIFPPEK